MKPNFALSLSFDGIRLLHRAAGGWREVGEVAITSDDLAGELAMLRKTAASLEPGGVRSKLIIPSSQIKYLTIMTPGLSDPARRKEAESALHDATPYEVSDLVYDISVEGPKTHVAAVARETLAEAEAFATEHRFHPVSFVAVPEDAPYLGEPYFGPTDGAADLLEADETVEPDGIAVVVVGAIRPEPETLPAAEPTETPEEPVVEEASGPLDVSETAEAEATEVPATAAPSEDVLNKSEVTDEAQTPAPEPETVAETPTPVKAPSEPEKEAAAAPKATPTGPLGKANSAPAPNEEVVAKAPVAEEPAVQDKKAPSGQPELDLTPSSQPVQQPPEMVDAKEAAPTPEVKEQATEVPAAEPAPEASKPAPAPKTETPAAADAAGIPPAARAAALAAAAAVPEAKTPEFTSRKPVEAPEAVPTPAPAAVPLAEPKVATTGFASRRSAPEAPAKPLGGAQRIAVATPKPDSSSLTQAPPAADTATPPVAAKTGFFSRRKPRKGAAAPLPAAAAAVPAAGTEAERMTVFGARASEVGGKPRFLGLIMTVILLVFLAGVAAWAAVFLDDGIAGLMKNDTPRATASAPENQIDPEIIRTPDGITEDSNLAEGGVELAALDPVLSAEETAVVDALRDPRPEPSRPVITEAEAAARYAVTGVWPLAPETTLSGPSVDPKPAYLNSIDPRSGATDAIALPSLSTFETDTVLAAVVSPPPFGQRAVLDATGLIKPTVDGIVAPGGFTLIAASPPIKPPSRVLGGVVAVPAIPEFIVALGRARPKNRPLGLAERSERAALGGVSRIELAAFRPSLRPRSLQDRARENEAAKKEEERKAAEADQARAAAAAAAATAAAAAVLSVPDATQAVVAAPALQNATRLATARSIRPDDRPRNFARIVKRAQRAAPKETRVAAAASVAPRTVAPKVPSRASVARSATVKNAINLRKVNLIGVYGKPSSRRALVRLSNGRYKKVKVGDRIDGGRVSAISNSELRYNKSGRNVVLKMP